MIKYKLAKQQQTVLAEIAIFLMIASYLIMKIVQLWGEYQQLLDWTKTLRWKEAITLKTSYIKLETSFIHNKWKVSVYGVAIPELNIREYLVRYISGNQDKMSVYRYFGMKDKLDEVKNEAIKNIDSLVYSKECINT